MIDGFGRTIDYLRISITDRCNLRCKYCMPEEGVTLIPHEEILSYEEILRLTEIFARCGISKIKVTGGEPLVRRGAAELIGVLKKVPGIAKVTLTTNGTLLSGFMQELAAVQIDGINVSLDTLDPVIYQKITGTDCFLEVMKGIDKALNYPEIPLKINCVPMKMEGQNVPELAKLAKNNPVSVRYIEMMPLGMGKQFEFLSEEQILSELEKCYGTPFAVRETMGNGPAHYFSFDGFCGKIGFVSAMSHRFCDSCNRLRLTSAGYLKTCLQYEDGADLRSLLRSGASDQEISKLIRETVQKKPSGHCFGKKISGQEERHWMTEIGG